MAKQGKTPPAEDHRHNLAAPVSIRNGKTQVNPLIANPGGQVFHSIPYTLEQIPAAFPALDNDLAVENLTNDFDLTAADMQDLS